MNVTSTTPTATSAATTPASATTSAVNSLTPDDFLTLLMAQMQNQDPTQPMDPSQMVSQLATVSQVSEAVTTNTTLSSLLASSSLTQAEQLLGKMATSSDGAISGAVASVDVTSTGSTATLDNGAQLPLDGDVTIGAR